MLAGTVIVLWLAGRLLTDQYSWSQWLYWIPTPALLAPIVLGLLMSMRPARVAAVRRRRLLRWSAVAAATLVYFALIEHRMLRPAPAVLPPGSALRIMHWNAEPLPRTEAASSVRAVINVNADVTVLTDPGVSPQSEQLDSWMGQEIAMTAAGPFTIFTRLPILELRPLIMVDRIAVTIMRIDATELLGRPITMYMVDLPSDPKLGRMETAQRVRKMLDELTAPPADLVVGDFNIARGSASLGTMFPERRHAFASGGHGYGATFNRGWPIPLYHIDHILLDEDFRAVRYDLIDAGLSRHKAQVAWIIAPTGR